ncbi:hypothetical protein RSAG8_09498, partial [Rhizoctonia solani AG-8 WAC10335]
MIDPPQGEPHAYGMNGPDPFRSVCLGAKDQIHNEHKLTHSDPAFSSFRESLEPLCIVVDEIAGLGNAHSGTLPRDSIRSQLITV